MSASPLAGKMHSRIKGPVGLGKGVDDIGTRGSNLVVHGPHGRKDAVPSLGGQTACQERQTVGDSVGVEWLRGSDPGHHVSHFLIATTYQVPG
jgi:hypothetical protein